MQSRGRRRSQAVEAEGKLARLWLRCPPGAYEAPWPNGWIATGGPPLGGKSVLLMRLPESLAFAVRIEAIGDLNHAEPIWYPQGSGGRRTRKPTRPPRGTEDEEPS